MLKITLSQLKKIIRESVEEQVGGNPVAIRMAPPLGRTRPELPSTPSSVQADMEFDEGEARAGEFQRVIQMMTNIGAFLDNPNTSRRSLTGLIAAGDRAGERRLVEEINTMHRQLVPYLTNLASDNETFEPNIRAALNNALRTIREVIYGIRNLANQPAETQLQQIRQFKQQYISATAGLRNARNRFAATSRRALAFGRSGISTVTVGEPTITRRS